eukprot:447912_1
MFSTSIHSINLLINIFTKENINQYASKKEGIELNNTLNKYKRCDFCKKLFCHGGKFGVTWKSFKIHGNKTRFECVNCWNYNTERWLKEEVKPNDKIDIFYSGEWHICYVINIKKYDYLVTLHIYLDDENTDTRIQFFNDDKIINKLQPLNTYTAIHECYPCKYRGRMNKGTCYPCKRKFCKKCALVLYNKIYQCSNCLSNNDYYEKYKLIHCFIDKNIILNKYTHTLKKEKENITHLITKYSIGMIFVHCDSVKCNNYATFNNIFQFIKSDYYTNQNDTNMYCRKCITNQNIQSMNKTKEWLLNMKLNDKLDICVDQNENWSVATILNINNFKHDCMIKLFLQWVEYNYKNQYYALEIMNKLQPLHTHTVIHTDIAVGVSSCKYSRADTCNSCNKIFCRSCVQLVSVSSKNNQCFDCVLKNDNAQTIKLIHIMIKNTLINMNINKSISAQINILITKYSIDHVFVKCESVKCKNYVMFENKCLFYLRSDKHIFCDNCVKHWLFTDIKIKINAKVDICDENNKWYVGTVYKINESENKLFVKYSNSSTDKCFEFNYKTKNKIQPLHTHTPIHKHNKCNHISSNKCHICNRLLCHRCASLVLVKSTKYECLECISDNDYNEKYKLIEINLVSHSNRQDLQVT